MCLSQPTAHGLVAYSYTTMPHGHLENDVSRQQPSISGNHSVTVNVLNNDVNQRGFAAPHQPNGEAFTGIHSIDFDACNFPIWNQVVQPWEGWNGQKQDSFQTFLPN